MDRDNEKTPWCCDGHAASCPLCPQYGTRATGPCLEHPYDGSAQTVVDMARLHAERRHPDYEYATTEGPRKQWDGVDDRPRGDDGESEAGWERNVDAGMPGEGWERFDYTEESYWRRSKQAVKVACAVLHKDDEGNAVPCPGCPHARDAEPDEQRNAGEGHPEPPSDEELNSALPVYPDPRQLAYDAVYEYIRGLGAYLPPDPVHRNAVIWRAAHAALAATPVGRCVSSHCVEGDHVLIVHSPD